MKKYLFLLLIVSNFCFAQKPVGVFKDHKDIGHPKNRGLATFDQPSMTYTLKAYGHQIWYNKDEFQYAYSKIKGDFILTANFHFMGIGVNHRKTGWMVRASGDEDAVHCSAVVHGDGLTVLQWRPVKGAMMRDPQDELFAPEKAYTMIQLERTGKKFIMRAAKEGEVFTEIGSTVMANMPDEVMAGIFACAFEDTPLECTVTNVKVVGQAGQ